MKVTDRELAKIVGRNYELFKELYPDKEFSLLELATKTGKDAGNLSKLITSLERKGIVETKNVERVRGRPFRYIKLSEKVTPIISSIIDAVKPEKPRRLVKFDRRRVNELLLALDPSKIKSQNHRRRRAALFEHYCSNPDYGICEHEEVLKVFRQMVEEPENFTEAVEQEVASRFYGALNGAIRWMLEGGKAYSEVQRVWLRMLKNVDFTEHVYCKALEHARDKRLNENLRSKFLKLLDTVYLRKAEKQREILNLALSLCSDEDLKLESTVYERAKGILYRVFHSTDEELKWEIYELIQEKAYSESENERNKFEPIAGDFFERLMEPRYEEV